MAGNGPPPTPTAVLAARGSPRAALREGEPQIDAELPEMPDWVGRTPSARAAWLYVAPLLVAAGILTKVDQVALALYCSTLARWLRANETLENEGEFYEARTESGTRLLPRPESVVATALLAELRQQGNTLGLNAAARARVRAAAKAAPAGKIKPWEVVKGGVARRALPASPAAAAAKPPMPTTAVAE